MRRVPERPLDCTDIGGLAFRNERFGALHAAVVD